MNILHINYDLSSTHFLRQNVQKRKTKSKDTLKCLGNLANCFPERLEQFTFPWEEHEGPDGFNQYP